MVFLHYFLTLMLSLVPVDLDFTDRVVAADNCVVYSTELRRNWTIMLQSGQHLVVLSLFHGFGFIELAHRRDYML